MGLVCDNAWVSGDAWVYGDAWVSGNARVDSASAIIVICIAMKYSVTITRSLIFIGCKSYRRDEVKLLTEDLAEKDGLLKQYYKGYRQMILGAMKLVKPLKKGK